MKTYEDRVGRVSHGFSDWIVQGGFATAFIFSAVTAVDYVSVLDDNYVETADSLSKLDPSSEEFKALNSSYGFWAQVLGDFKPAEMSFVTEFKNPALWGMVALLSGSFATARHFRS